MHTPNRFRGGTSSHGQPDGQSSVTSQHDFRQIQGVPQRQTQADDGMKHKNRRQYNKPHGNYRNNRGKSNKCIQSGNASSYRQHNNQSSRRKNASKGLSNQICHSKSAGRGQAVSVNGTSANSHQHPKVVRGHGRSPAPDHFQSQECQLEQCNQYEEDNETLDDGSTEDSIHETKAISKQSMEMNKSFGGYKDRGHLIPQIHGQKQKNLKFSSKIESSAKNTAKLRDLFLNVSLPAGDLGKIADASGTVNLNQTIGFFGSEMVLKKKSTVLLKSVGLATPPTPKALWTPMRSPARNKEKHSSVILCKKEEEKNRPSIWKSSSRLYVLQVIVVDTTESFVGFYMTHRGIVSPMPDAVVVDEEVMFVYPETKTPMKMPPNFLFNLYPTEEHVLGQAVAGRYYYLDDVDKDMAEIHTVPNKYTISNLPDAFLDPYKYDCNMKSDWHMAVVSDEFGEDEASQDKSLERYPTGASYDSSPRPEGYDFLVFQNVDLSVVTPGPVFQSKPSRRSIPLPPQAKKSNNPNSGPRMPIGGVWPGGNLAIVPKSVLNLENEQAAANVEPTVTSLELVAQGTPSARSTIMPPQVKKCTHPNSGPPKPIGVRGGCPQKKEEAVKDQKTPAKKASGPNYVTPESKSGKKKTQNFTPLQTSTPRKTRRSQFSEGQSGRKQRFSSSCNPIRGGFGSAPAILCVTATSASRDSCHFSFDESDEELAPVPISWEITLDSDQSSILSPVLM